MRLSLTLARNVFLAIFIIATLAAFVILYRESSVTAGLIAQSSGLDPSAEPELVVQMQLEKITPVVASIITSLTTLLGFAVTTILNIRKERREGRESNLSLKQKEIELQRTLMELEELKRKVSQ